MPPPYLPLGFTFETASRIERAQAVVFLACFFDLQVPITIEPFSSGKHAVIDFLERTLGNSPQVDESVDESYSSLCGKSQLGSRFSCKSIADQVDFFASTKTTLLATQSLPLQKFWSMDSSRLNFSLIWEFANFVTSIQLKWSVFFRWQEQ